MRVQIQTAGTAYAAREIIMPAPGFNFENSTRFAGYNRGTNSSLLVVETWETSPFNDCSSYDYTPERISRDYKKLHMNDYSKMLLNAGLIEKTNIYNPPEKDSKSSSQEAIHYSKKKSGVALFK
jgi:hypothetical protein